MTANSPWAGFNRDHPPTWVCSLYENHPHKPENHLQSDAHTSVSLVEQQHAGHMSPCPRSRAPLHGAAVTCRVAVSGLQPQSSPHLAAPRLSPRSTSPAFCPCSLGTRPSAVSTDPTAHVFNTPTEVTKPPSPNLPWMPLSSRQSRTGLAWCCSRWPLLSSRRPVGTFPSL